MEPRRSNRIKSRGLTKPITPKLLTRSRPCTHKIESQADKENKEYEEMKRYKFSAKPPPSSTFGDEKVGIPKKKGRKVTQPKTPMALKRKGASKSRIGKAKKETNNAIKRLKALPLPDLKKVFEVAKKDVIKITQPKPFSFDSRDRHPNEVKEKLLKEAIEQEQKAREFTARPLYESTGFTIDKSLSKSCTQVKPFNISKPDFYDEKLKRQAEKVEQEAEELKKKAEFKANYPHVLYEPAFEPVKDSRLCDIEEFNLHSARRGVDRKKFDMELEEQRLMYEKEKRAEEEDREKRDAEKVKDLRKKMVHKANSVGQYRKQDYDNLK